MKEKEIALKLLSENSEPALASIEITDEQTFDLIGIDSLKFMLMVVELESQIGRAIFNIDNVSGVRKVGDLMQLLND